MRAGLDTTTGRGEAITLDGRNSTTTTTPTITIAPRRHYDDRQTDRQTDYPFFLSRSSLYYGYPPILFPYYSWSVQVSSSSSLLLHRLESICPDLAFNPPVCINSSLIRLLFHAIAIDVDWWELNWTHATRQCTVAGREGDEAKVLIIYFRS